MFRLSLLYFGIIIIMEFGINGHIYMHIPCEKCFISNYSMEKIHENEEFCQECISNYNNLHLDYGTNIEILEMFEEVNRAGKDPCNNFYDYTCDVWDNANYIFQTEWSPTEYNQLEVYHDVKRLLEKENEYDYMPFIKLTKRYYRSCIDEDVLEKRGLEPMQRMLNATGGWPIMMSKEEWYAKNYTWQKTDNDYFQLYNFFILFDISYLKNNKNLGIFMIDPFLQRPIDDELKIDTEQSYATKYNAITKVVRAFAKDKGIQIPAMTLHKDVLELITFETNLEKTGYKKKNPAIKSKTKMTITKLQKFYDIVATDKAEINWLDKIQMVSKLLNITVDSWKTVLVSNKEMLHTLAFLLDVTPQHVIVNYLQWHIVSTFMGNLNKQMRDIEQQYLLYDSNNGQQERRWLKCINEFQMKDALTFLYTKTFISPNTLQTVSDIFNDIKEEMMNYIQSLMWLNISTKKYMIQKIYDMSLNIGYFEWYDNQTALNEMYKDLEIDDNYFENILTIIKYQNIIEQTSFRESKHRDESLYRWSFYFLSNEPFYDQLYNVIYLSAATMKLPHFKPHETIVTIYGRIGWIIGELMARFVHLNIGTYLDENENLMFNIKIKQAFERRLQCILMPLERYHNFMLNITKRSVNLTKQYFKAYKYFTNEIIAHFIGTQIVFAAFQRRKQQSSPPKLLSDYRNYKITMKDVNLQSELLMNITQEQLFFLRSIELMCETIDNSSEKTSNFFKITKERQISFLINIEAFSEAFNCPVGSPMNPKFRCKNWNVTNEMTNEEHFYYDTNRI